MNNKYIFSIFLSSLLLTLPVEGTTSQVLYHSKQTPHAEAGPGRTVIINYPDPYPQRESSRYQQTQIEQPPINTVEYQAPNRVWEPDRFGPPHRRIERENPFEYRPLRR